MQLNAEMNMLDLQQKLELSKNPLNRHPENAMPAQWGWLSRKEYVEKVIKKSGMQHGDCKEPSQQIYHVPLGNIQQQNTHTAFSTVLC